MKLQGAEIIIKFLEEHGIETVTGIPGGSNLPLYDALHKSSIRHILTRHEQGAGFIAQGMARTTGKASVCFATSGPGITNLITAIADAKHDSIPLVAFTGQVSSSKLGTQAFQEVDTYSMTKPITKKNYLVTNPHDLAYILPEAFALAQNGRPGPVVIDVPKDIQSALIEFDDWQRSDNSTPHISLNRDTIAEIAAIINNARRPVLYAGGGIMHANASSVLMQVAQKNSIPVTLTLMGLGAFPPGDPLYLGMLGMHGSQATNHVLDKADLLLACGARFDDRAIGKAEEFCPHAKIVHIDIDPLEIDKIKKTTVSLVADSKDALEALLPLLQANKRTEWISTITGIKEKYAKMSSPRTDPLQPYQLITYINSITPANAIITTDVGQHQMWVAQAYMFQHPRTFLTSGGLGTMGFGLPAAIGASLAHPDTQVLCFTGDGSLQMNIQELATLAELGCNVKILVMNNQQLGLVRQQQELFYNQNYIATKFSSCTNFAAIASQYGIPGIALNETHHIRESIEMLLQKQGPCLIDIPIHEAENVFPIVPPGAANRDMLSGEGKKCASLR